MASKSFKFVADTVNGEIQEFPPTMTFTCGTVEAVGVEIIRAYTINDCIESVRVFLIRQGNNIFGSKSFKTKAEFLQYLNTSCACCQEAVRCYLLINGCYMRINGFSICLK